LEEATTEFEPVIAVLQTDIMFYGFDLVGYFHAEFEVALAAWISAQPRPFRSVTDHLGRFSICPKLSRGSGDLRL